MSARIMAIDGAEMDAMETGTEAAATAPRAQQQAAAELAELEAGATRHHTPSGKGRMVWRRWGRGEPLVLLHGGAGAWSHWARNIPALMAHRTVWAPDLPGLGDSDPPETLTIEGIGETLVQGLRTLVPEGPLDLVGFSFGGPTASYVATRMPGRIRHFMLAGSRFVLGEELQYPRLVNWKDIADPQQRLAAHASNLRAMMIADPAKVDALAVHIQASNAPKASFFGMKLDPTGKLQQYLPQVRASASFTGVSGRADQFSWSFMDRQEAGIRALDARGRFHIIDGAGHWVQYEAAERFNAILLDVLLQDGASAPGRTATRSAA